MILATYQFLTDRKAVMDSIEQEIVALIGDSSTGSILVEVRRPTETDIEAAKQPLTEEMKKQLFALGVPANCLI